MTGIYISPSLRIMIAALLTLTLSACSDNSNNAAPEKTETRISVYAAQTRIGAIQSWVFAEGTARSASREYLMFQSAGKITYVAPDLREGSVVKKGMLLAQQDQRSLKADMIEARTAINVAQAELKQAKTQAVLAEKTFNRFATLLEQISASQQEYDEAKAKAENAKADILRAQSNIFAAKARLDQKQVRLEESELRAPSDGMVAYLNIEKGYYFMPGVVRTDSEEAALNTVPIVLIDPATFDVNVNIPVYDRDRVLVGQTVLIQTGHSQQQLQSGSSQGNMPLNQDTLLKSRTGQIPPKELDSPDYLQGVVYSVNPTVSPSGLSIQVTIRTGNEKQSLKDGMYVTAWIATERHENVVTAPLEAFLFRDNQPFVFVVDKDKASAALHAVSLGLQGFDRREVLSGVTPGQWLVTEGRYQLSNGARVRILEEELAQSAQHPAVIEHE